MRLDSTIYLVSIRMKNTWVIAALMHSSVNKNRFIPPSIQMEYTSLCRCLGPGQETGVGHWSVYGWLLERSAVLLQWACSFCSSAIHHTGNIPCVASGPRRMRRRGAGTCPILIFSYSADPSQARHSQSQLTARRQFADPWARNECCVSHRVLRWFVMQQ